MLYRSLKNQLSKIQGVKDAMKRRTDAISKYKSNLMMIKKKRVKEESNYNYISLHKEIEELVEENKVLESKITKINNDLCNDLTDLSVTEVVENEVHRFSVKYKQDVEVG